MVTIVKDEQSKLQDEYAPLRVKIFNHYRDLALVGAAPGAAEHRLPPKLGHWTDRHSALVRAVSAELAQTVQRIDELRALRDPARIKAQRPPTSPALNFKRKGLGKTRPQLNPGEWPPKY
jgi:hypothetical protein